MSLLAEAMAEGALDRIPPAEKILSRPVYDLLRYGWEIERGLLKPVFERIQALGIDPSTIRSALSPNRVTKWWVGEEDTAAREIRAKYHIPSSDATASGRRIFFIRHSGGWRYRPEDMKSFLDILIKMSRGEVMSDSQMWRYSGPLSGFFEKRLSKYGEVVYHGYHLKLILNEYGRKVVTRALRSMGPK